MSTPPFHFTAAPASAEPQAASSDEQYRQMFEAAGIGIARLSLDGRFLEVNARFAEITGHHRDELLDMRRQDLRSADDLALEAPQLQATLAGQQSRYKLDCRFAQPGGQTVWATLTTALVRDASGQPLYFVSVVEDISERRRFEEALTSAKAAERASKAKTDFLSSMSHELRTPLNAMLGFAQLLRVDRTNPLNDIQRKKVAHIESAGAHLLAMLTDVLDLSRIEAGGLMLSWQSLSAAAVLEEAVALVSNQAHEAGLTLIHTPPDDDLFVKADQVRLRQIMVNLLSNAIKYNRAGGRVLVDAHAQGAYVVISVADSGRGLSVQQQEHLFEPFNRLGAERTAVEGTGIGLVIVKRLVDLMNGRLEVSSQLDVGTRFDVFLPATISPQVPLDARPSGPGRLGGRSTWGSFDALNPGVLTILYAEDNMVNVELVRQVLRLRPKWHLEVARSGAQAIEMARATPPDLLLLDMHLGDMNGVDVSDALARDPATSEVPRVALSADAMPDQVEAARSRGFVDYLTKPLDVERLLKLLDRLAKDLQSEGGALGAVTSSGP